MNSENLLVLLSGLLAVILEYFPGLAGKFAGLTDWQKRAVVVGLLFLLALVTHLAQCEQGFGACGLDGQVVWGFLRDVLTGGAVNQGVYLLAKRTSR